MAKLCKDMTRFTSRCGTCKFQIVLFGLGNARSLFLRMTDVATQGLLFVRLYIVDVNTFCKAMSEHASRT